MGTATWLDFDHHLCNCHVGIINYPFLHKLETRRILSVRRLDLIWCYFALEQLRQNNDVDDRFMG